MTDRNPKVTIGLPVYNGAEFLAKALDSLLAQTFGDFELIISDNASDDDTGQIGRRYALRDPRVRYYLNAQNIGAAPNFNRTVELSRGEFFMWAAHDDLWDPSYLENCVAALENDPGVVLACALTEDIDQDGALIVKHEEYRRATVALGEMALDAAEPPRRFRDLIGLEHLCEPIFGLMRSRVLHSTPLHGKYADADRVLLAEFALYGRFNVIPKILFFHREHVHRSVSLHPGRHERTVWMDPKKAGRILFPHFRELLEFAKCAGRPPLPFGQRLAAYLHLLPWTLRYRRRLFNDLTNALLLAARKATPEPVRRKLKKILGLDSGAGTTA